MQSGKPERNFAARTIWTGDNLDILRGLNSEAVDLIYLDPPFNSNKTYSAPIGSKAAGAAFKDSWTLDDLDVAWLGLIADRHPGMYRVIEAAGTAHGRRYESLPVYDGHSVIGTATSPGAYRLDLPSLRPNSVTLSQTPDGRGIRFSTVP